MSLEQEIRKMIVARNKSFEEFTDKNIDFTQKVQTSRELIMLNKEYDCFICGSDQIWNPENFNGVYYLNFVNDKNKKISYAPSFGVSKIPVSMKEEIKHLVNKFNWLSVRENSGESILRELTNKKIEIVVDPTLLLSKTDWEQISEDPKVNNDYILCYFLGNSREYWKTVQYLHRITTYKVIIIPIKYNSYFQKYEIRPSTSPKEFLGLIKNARLVLTDSFHGIIFSLIFKKDFFAFKRFVDRDKWSQNARVYSLLGMLNLENRLIDYNTIKAYKDNYFIDNYNEINKVLGEKIDSSIAYLTKALQHNDN